MTLQVESKTFSPDNSGGYDYAGTYFSASGAVITDGLDNEIVFDTFNGSAIQQYASTLNGATITLSYTLSNSDFAQNQQIQVSGGHFAKQSDQNAIESDQSDSGALTILTNAPQIDEVGVKNQTETQSDTLSSDAFSSTGLDSVFAFYTNQGGLTYLSNVSITVTGFTYTNLPYLSDHSTEVPVLDDLTDSPFANVAIYDPSNPSGFGDQITVTVEDQNGVANGTLGTLSLPGDPSDLISKGNGVYALRTTLNTLAQQQAALDALVFTPSTVQSFIGTQTVILKFTDASVGGSQGTGSVSDSLIVIHDARTLLPGTTQSGTDAAPFHALAGVYVTDPFNGDQVGAKLTVGSGQGTLSGSGLTANADGSYTLASTFATTLTQELQGLTFTAAPGQAPIGAVAQDAITIVASSSDGWTSTLVDDVPVTATVVQTPSITGQGAVTTSREGTAHPFSNVSVTDPNYGGMETVYITSPSVTSSGASGTLTGLGLSGPTDYGGTVGFGYSVTGTAASVTAQLRALVFTPAKGAPNSSQTTSFTLTDSATIATAGSSKNLASVSDASFTVTNTDVPVPAVVSGSAALTTTSEAPVTPFATAVVTDANTNATDVLTIGYAGHGTLSGTGLSGGGGTYRLSGTAATVTAQLQALVFTPGAGTAGTSATTRFTLQDAPQVGVSFLASSQTDSGFTVTDTDPPYVPPTLSGSANLSVQSEAPITPFDTATLTDTNANSTDTLAIQLTGGGTLAGAGLSGSAAAGYSLAGTAAQVTAALQALVFTPAAGAPNSSAVTSFALTDTATSGLIAADTVFTVRDNDPAVAPVLSGAASLVVGKGSVAHPFATATLSDPNANSSDRLTIEISGNSGGLSGPPLSGTVAQLTAALQAQTFTTYGSGTTTFTVIDRTSAQTTASDAGFSVTTDPGPTLAPGSVAVGAGRTVPLTATLLGLVTPGLSGDTETVTAVSAATGTATVGAGGAVTYAAPASGSDTVTYTVADQFGDAATGTLAVSAVPAKITLAVPAAATLGATPTAAPYGVETITGTLAASPGASAGGQTVTLSAGGQALATAQPIVTDAKGAFSAAIALPASSFTLQASAQDSAGVAATTAAAVDGQVDALAFGAVTTDPNSRPGEVYALYEAILGRAPDPGGFAANVSYASTEGSPGSLAQAMLSSPEFTAGYGPAASLTPAQFVTGLYENALHRAPEADGLQGWEADLNTGATQAQVALGVALSPESIGDITPAFQAMGGAYAPNETDAGIARLYYGLLGRTPDVGGLAGAEAALFNGASLTDVANSILQSPEYLQASSGLNDTHYVSQLYVDALGRAPDAGGLQGWVGELAAGGTRASVALGITGSAEAMQHLYGQVEGGFKVM